MNTASQPMYEWNTIPWSHAQPAVFKLQKRIYQASCRGDTKTVHQLQRLLMKSWWACLLAVRRVTQDNQGKNTAGVDGVKRLTPHQRMTLADHLHTAPLIPKSPPVRRVWIPKPGTTEQRPLGIPVMEQRARQALVKLALEPEWEAKFEPNSYGFRPGRSAHDAIEAIFNGIRTQAKYVLDADVAKCFERINHSALLAKLQTFPTLRRVINAWLKAGILDGDQLFPSTAGVPQGGVLSPLLANIALHGLETAIQSAFPQEKRYNDSRRRWKPTVIRYADDFVVLHQDRAVIEQCQDIANEWLADMGLRLKPSKTQIVHTLQHENDTVGFTFLGFHIRHYRVGKTHTSKSGGPGRTTTLLGFTTIIKPSPEALKRHSKHLKDIIRIARAWSQDALIQRLNPIIRGWTGYYSSQASTHAFATMSHQVYQKLWSWARHRHRDQSSSTIYATYWPIRRGRRVFATPQGRTLYRHTDRKIERHIKVAGTRSPYHGDWVYWASRQSKHPDTPRRSGCSCRQSPRTSRLCSLSPSRA